MNLSEARHAFITGGASGLGLGMADALARRGIAVTIADIDAEALAKVTATRGNSVRGVELDVRDREAWAEAKQEAEAAFGPVDMLICNAGISPNGREFADMAPESFDIILQINLMGVVNGVFAFAAQFRERGKGHVVLTSSQAGLVTTVAGVGAYSVAKFGVTALGEQLRRELAPHGVGVSVLCPGFVQTNLGENTVKIGGRRQPLFQRHAAGHHRPGRCRRNGRRRDRAQRGLHRHPQRRAARGGEALRYDP